MKKLFLLSVMAVVSMVAMAQDKYTEGIVELMNISAPGGVTLQRDKLVETFQEAGLGAKAETIADEIIVDLVSLSVEEYKAHGVTLEDMENIKVMYATPEGKQFLEHTAKMQEPEYQQKLQQVLMPAMMALFSGDPTASIETPTVSASYKQKFHTYFVGSNMKSTVDNVFDSIKSMMASQTGAEEAIEMLQQFFHDQSENLMLATCGEVYTEADLDFGNNLLSTPYGKRIVKAGSALAPKMTAIMLEKFQKMM